MAKRFPGLLAYLDYRLGQHTGHGPEYQFFCPFCIDRTGSESSHRKLWVNMTKQMACCYRCGYGARDMLKFLRNLNGGKLRFEELDLLKGEITPPTTSVRDTVLEMLYTAHMHAPPSRKSVPLPREAVSLVGTDFDDAPFSLRRAVDYLNGRGVSQRLVERFDIHYCATGKYAGYLIFPVYQSQKLVYFTSRYAGESKYKTKNPPNDRSDRSHRRNTVLLNYDNSFVARRVCIVEGPFDCMAVPDGVALMGKVISTQQVKLLSAMPYVKEFVVYLDSEALQEAVTVRNALRDRVRKVTVLSTDSGDPWDRRAEYKKLIKLRGSPSLRELMVRRLRR